MAAPEMNRLTTAAGAPVPNNQNSQTAGAGGPVLLQDHHLLEKLAHFNRERIPERVVHAVGIGAGGTFEVTKDVTQYTQAKFLSEIGKQTEVFVRFSTVAGSQGAPDTARDPRGFAVKFYTEDGNYDLVGQQHARCSSSAIRSSSRTSSTPRSPTRGPRSGAGQRLGLLRALAGTHPPVHLAVR